MGDIRTAKDYLAAEIAKSVEEAREIVRKAEDENRSLTDDERGSVDEKTSQAAMLKARMQELEDNEKLRKSIDALGVVGKADGPAEQGQPLTVGDAFIKSEAYQALKKGGIPAGSWRTGAVEVARAFPFGGKAAGDPITTAQVVGADIPQQIPGVQGPVEQALTIADLLGAATATSASISYLEETNTDNNAAAIAEGAAKPDSWMDFTRRTEDVAELASFLPVTDTFLEDEAALASYLNGRLAFFVRQEEERQLLNGNGTAPNLSGILDRAIGTAVATDIGGNNLYDAILAAMTEVRNNGGLEPDAMVIHPTDAAELAVKKNVQGFYFGAGPFAAPSSNPWGLRAVVTNAIAVNTVLVGAFRQGATVYRKGGLTVEASNSHSDFFKKNMTAIRASERLALVVYRPLAFCTASHGS